LNPASEFRTTRWTEVVAAQGDSAASQFALRQLCASYYEPVAFFIARFVEARKDHDPQYSEALTHDFFAKLLDSHSLKKADRTRGRFRTYLLGAVKHFLYDAFAREAAAKRGGDHQIVSIDQVDSSALRMQDDDVSRLDLRDPHGFPSDAYFDRQWALTVVKQSMDSLKQEAEKSGESIKFEVLSKWLIAPTQDTQATAAAESIGLSDNAFRVTVHRLRKRFRAIVSQHISETLDEGDDLQSELNYLVAALAATTNN
jgi:hypothetical protein